MWILIDHFPNSNQCGFGIMTLRLVVRPHVGSRLAPRGAWALLFKAESANLGQFASTHCPHLRCYYFICERCFGISFTAHAYCIRART